MATTIGKKNFTSGPIFFKLTLFALPIMMTGLLQVLYNTADNIVVGSFSGDELALAAVGCTGTLTTFIVNLLMGVSTGASVLISQTYGARDYDRLSRTVHTAMTFAFFGGIAFMLLSILISEPALLLMGTKEELMSRALLYFRIICTGIPATIIYNFIAAILRAVGDSKTPLIVLSLSGLANVLLNLLFVIVFGMGVAGVAIATIISQYLSALALLVVLILRKNECYGLNLRKLGIDTKTLSNILAYGIPTAVQSSLFSVSNIIITTAGNSLSTAAVSARTIIGNIDGFVYTAMNSYMHATMTFVGQNYGAGKIDRIKKSILYSIVQVLIIGITMSQLLLVFRHEAISLFIDKTLPNAAAIEQEASDGIVVILAVYVLCGVMETLSGALRGMGRTISPMIISITGACGLRMIWIFGFFYTIKELNNLAGLYLCYPISWGACIVAMGIAVIYAYRKISRETDKERLESIEQTVG